LVYTLTAKQKSLLPKKDPIQSLLMNAELLPDTIAKGRVLKVTFYDFLGKEDSEKNSNKKDRSGTCRGLLYALDDNVQILEHEHKDTGSPTDNIELYSVPDDLYKDLNGDPLVKDLNGNPLSKNICLIGNQHGISSMRKGAIVDTLKIDRAHAQTFLKQFDELEKDEKELEL
jgi:hypothetical protein